MLVAMAVTLILIAALAQAFAIVGEAVSQGRAVIERDYVPLGSAPARRSSSASHVVLIRDLLGMRGPSRLDPRSPSRRRRCERQQSVLL